MPQLGEGNGFNILFLQNTICILEAFQYTRLNSDKKIDPFVKETFLSMETCRVQYTQIRKRIIDIKYCLDELNPC